MHRKYNYSYLFYLSSTILLKCVIVPNKFIIIGFIVCCRVEIYKDNKIPYY